ncbi:hypothetical protein FPV67DRAFT_1729403 [Lyophyllum atratum]|nr:hypothetical protein FPV67DRAFT_1729403 [Lyophyllum atratum]
MVLDWGITLGAYKALEEQLLYGGDGTTALTVSQEYYPLSSPLSTPLRLQQRQTLCTKLGLLPPSTMQYPYREVAGHMSCTRTLSSRTRDSQDSEVSPLRHLIVSTLEPIKIFIRDMDSLNGTFVNGERLSEEGCCSEPYELRTDAALPQLLANDRSSSLGKVDENWLRMSFIEPLLSYNPKPMVFIIESLDTDNLELLRPLTMLAVVSRSTLKISMRFFLATHPDIRRQTLLGPHINSRILKDLHTILILDNLQIPRLGMSASDRLLKRPLKLKAQIWRTTPLSPLGILIETIYLHKSPDLVLNGIRSIVDLDDDPAFGVAIERDNLEDEATYTSLLRVIIRDDTKAAEELGGSDAQIFVDFGRDLSDRGALLERHGSDFDRKARRSISNVVAKSDQLPTSIFLQMGVILDPEPFSGGGFEDIYRATPS